MELRFRYFLRRVSNLTYPLNLRGFYQHCQWIYNITRPVSKSNGTVIILSNTPNSFMLVPCDGVASHVGKIVIQPSCPMLVTLWRSSIPSRGNSSTRSCFMLTYINRIEIQSCGPLTIASRLWPTRYITFYLPYICLPLNFSWDVDECSATDTHNCSRDGGECHNTKGSYKCQCRPGYTGDGQKCTGEHGLWLSLQNVIFWRT